MSKSVMHNLCPYTLRSLTDLEDVNDEHIFPDAVGGVKDYSVRVSTKVNSELGSRIDAPLVESFLIAGLRLQHGIKSRSGKSAWRMRGETADSGHNVEVTFPEEGDVEIRFIKPAVMSDDGASGKLILKPEPKASFLRQFIENHKRKGHEVRVIAESTSVAEEIKVPITVDLLALKRGISKIAFLAVYEYLGDEFLSDPLVREWHRAFLSDKKEDALCARIHGSTFNCQDLFGIIMPPLQPYEHAAVVANLNMRGVVVAVSLFGSGFHNLLSLASETSNYGLKEGEGKIVICNAKSGRMQFIDFMDHLVKKSRKIPIFGLDWGIPPDDLGSS